MIWPQKVGPSSKKYPGLIPPKQRVKSAEKALPKHLPVSGCNPEGMSRAYLWIMLTFVALFTKLMIF